VDEGEIIGSILRVLVFFAVVQLVLLVIGLTIRFLWLLVYLGIKFSKWLIRNGKERKRELRLRHIIEVPQEQLVIFDFNIRSEPIQRFEMVGEQIELAYGMRGQLLRVAIQNVRMQPREYLERLPEAFQLFLAKYLSKKE